MSQLNAEKAATVSGNTTPPVAQVRPIHEPTNERAGPAASAVRNSQFQNTRPPASGGGTVQQPKSNRTLMWIALTMVFGLAAAGLVWHRANNHQQTGLPSPASTGAIVPVPSLVDELPKGLANPTEGSLTGLKGLPSSPASAVATALPPVVKISLEDVVQKVENLAANVKELLIVRDDHESRIAALESELQALKEQQAKVTAPRPLAAVRRHAVVRRPAAPVPTPPISQQQDDSAQLLSVDVWDGKPSVAVGRSHGGASDVRFLTEGDTQGKVTVKKADVGSQRAVLSTDKGEIVLSRDQQ